MSARLGKVRFAPILLLAALGCGDAPTTPERNLEDLLEVTPSFSSNEVDPNAPPWAEPLREYLGQLGATIFERYVDGSIEDVEAAKSIAIALDQAFFQLWASSVKEDRRSEILAVLAETIEVTEARLAEGGISAAVADELLTAAEEIVIDHLLPPATVVRFRAGSGAQFTYLAPLLEVDPPGPLATGLEPVVTVCDAAGPPSCLELDVAEVSGHYEVDWGTQGVPTGGTYTVRVLQRGLVLGIATVSLVGRRTDPVDRSFPIAFWIGEALATVVTQLEPCLAGNRCNAAVVPDDEGTVVVTTQDEATGATMAVLSLPAASIPVGGFVVAVDCREDAGFDPGDGPLPTSLTQWPLFCHVEATNPDGTPFTAELPGEAVIEICVVDESIPGQSDFHPFEGAGESLVLGKSNGPGDFSFLPPAPSALTCAGNTTTAYARPMDRILDGIGSRLTSAMGLLMPEGLKAAAMFRDGGVGGQIRSFSDINPVEPGIIEGTVDSHTGEGLEGVTVVLSGAAAATTTTDAEGVYSFGPLQAAEDGGSTYTVTVEDLPEGEELSEPSQVVQVTGSGHFHADFVTDAPVPGGVWYWDPASGGNGHYYEYVTGFETWTAAEAAAAARVVAGMNGHLATITSPAEQIFVNSIRTDSLDLADWRPWIGLSDAALEGTFAWVTGEAFAYTNWNTGEPNNAGGGEDYVEMFASGVWNDVANGPICPCGYLVEYEPEAPGPAPIMGLDLVESSGLVLLPPGTFNPFPETAFCPEGLVPLGGGFAAQDSDGVRVIESRPIGDSWQVTVWNSGSSSTSPVTSVLCAEAPPGYNIVVEAGASILPGGFNADPLDARCGPGQVVLGGGLLAQSGDGVRMVQSRPTTTDTWAISVWNSGTLPSTPYAYAVCADEPAGWNIQINAGPVIPPGTINPVLDAVCDAGQSVLGGGMLALDGDGVRIIESRPIGGDRWRVSLFNSGALSSRPFSYAICADT